jgi:hypothetical protein
MRLAVLSLLCLLASCFQEPPADRVWRCSAAQPLCPEGQTCINDWCTKDGTAMPDLANSDAGGGGGDMSKPPCTDGFPIGTQGVWACRGTFSPATALASALCKNGFKLCADGLKLTDSECSSSAIKGFFFSDLPAQGTTGTLAKCVSMPPGPGAGSYYYGCGTLIGGVTPAERASMACKGLPLVSYCDNQSLKCNSFTDLRLDAQSGLNASNGVLCCPP